MIRASHSTFIPTGPRATRLIDGDGLFDVDPRGAAKLLSRVRFTIGEDAGAVPILMFR